MSLDRAAVRSRMKKAAQRGAAEALAVLAAEARSRTPVESGRLRDSCQVRTEGLGGAVVYTAPYAAARHEKREGGKFLENACYDPAVRADMAEAVRRAFAEEMR